jgi:hypothetical protein
MAPKGPACDAKKECTTLPFDGILLGEGAAITVARLIVEISGQGYEDGGLARTGEIEFTDGIPGFYSTVSVNHFLFDLYIRCGPRRRVYPLLRS